MRKGILLLLIISIAVISAVSGAYVARSHFYNSFEGAQANISFGQLSILGQIQQDMELGCSRQAYDRLSHVIDENKMLIAEYLQTNDDIKLEEYIQKRDPGLLKELKQYPVDWDKKWSIKGCDEFNNTKQ